MLDDGLNGRCDPPAPYKRLMTSIEVELVNSELNGSSNEFICQPMDNMP